METKEMNAMLRKRARDLGLCDKWYRDWDKNETRQELINKYIKGIDFCIEHDYPKIDFIRANFPMSQLNKNGIFLDGSVSEKNIGTVVLLSGADADLGYDGLSVGNIYARHDSVARIKVKGNARVFVETYEDCDINIDASDESKAFVYVRGGKVSHTGNVVVRDKRKNGD